MGCTKQFSFAVSNNLKKLDMTGKSKKKQKNMIRNAVVKYFQKVLEKKFGEGKSPGKKKFKALHSRTNGSLLGADGFIVKHVLAKADEFDYFHAPSKLGESLTGESGLVFCEWTGATEAVFYILEPGVKEIK